VLRCFGALQGRAPANQSRDRLSAVVCLPTPLRDFRVGVPGAETSVVKWNATYGRRASEGPLSERLSNRLIHYQRYTSPCCNISTGKIDDPASSGPSSSRKTGSAFEAPAP
jgi:hypothetical protein